MGIQGACPLALSLSTLQALPTPMEHRSLILRANRFLGPVLVQRGLVLEADLEKANEKLLELIQSNAPQEASLLKILIFRLGVLDESKLIADVLEKEQIGLVDLSHYEKAPILEFDLDLDLCQATWTLPYAKIDDFFFVATTYYLSAPVREHWQTLLGANILWYATDMKGMIAALEEVFSFAGKK